MELHLSAVFEYTKLEMPLLRTYNNDDKKITASFICLRKLMSGDNNRAVHGF